MSRQKPRAAGGKIVLAALFTLTGILLIAIGAAALLGETPAPEGETLTQSEATPSTVEETPAVEEPAVSCVLNPLTGQQTLAEDMAGTRPVAFMINNAKASLPHNGISNFDVVFELPVEGAYTRLMGVTSDYRQAARYGSIRSARHDFVELAASLNAVLVHWGGSDFAYSAISQYGVTDLDGMVYGTSCFLTDTSLGRAIEHTRFIEPSGLSKGLNIVAKSMASSDTDTLFSFNANGSAAGTLSAQSASVAVTSEVTDTFVYDSEKQSYLKGEYGVTETDGNTGEPVYVENVMVLFATVSLMSDGVHRDISLTSGSGYYLSSGTAQAIHWSKGSAAQPLTLTTESGAVLSVNPGKSWIIFTGNGRSSVTLK